MPKNRYSNQAKLNRKVYAKRVEKTNETKKRIKSDGEKKRINLLRNFIFIFRLIVNCE